MSINNSEGMFDHSSASEDAVLHYLAYFNKFGSLDDVNERAADTFNTALFQHAVNTQIQLDEDKIWFMDFPIVDVVQIILEIRAGFKDKWKTAENKKALVRLTSDKKLLSALLKYLVESSNERYENENSDDLFKVINELTTWANNH